jgi:hypothetical protein
MILAFYVRRAILMPKRACQLSISSLTAVRPAKDNSMRNHLARVSRVARRATKALMPKFMLRMHYKLFSARVRRRLAGLSIKEKFTLVYTEHLWGRPADATDPFFSGTGSRNTQIVGTYVAAVEAFLSKFPEKPNVVDLGCGDFFVGSKVRHLCATYIACDVVEPLIARNRVKYAGIGVDFRVVDITQDELPGGDVVFIRQVLQHLSNKDIEVAIEKIRQQYSYLVLTEPVPSSHFTPNVDHTAGPDTRPNSGVVLTSPPFNLPIKSTALLCEIAEYGGLIQTFAYHLESRRQ